MPEPWLEDPDCTLYHGDVLDVLRELPDGSVHMCATSPPFYGLRDYGVERQIGLEETSDEWVASLVAVFREVRRVLRDDGTLWVEIGDSYSRGRSGRDDNGRTSEGREAGWVYPEIPSADRPIPPGHKDKDLLGQPWLLAFALRADGWYLRSEIIWARPNPMPESVTDRPTKAHSTIFLLSKRPRYFFDADAIREPHQHDGRKVTTVQQGDGSIQHRNGERWPGTGANARSVWWQATEPTPFAHFATWPQKLVARMILAGTSERGCCPECGAPWVRETAAEYENPGNRQNNGTGGRDRRDEGVRVMSANVRLEKRSTTLGWSPSCAHDGIDRRLVLSPTGERVGEDPSLRTGRAGMNRPRGDNEGRRPITRHEQSEYARQLRESPHREQMRSEAGEPFAHYVRTDDSGARPVPDELLEAWIGRGWLKRVTVPPAADPPAPVPCTVLDPFAGSGTTCLVARNHGRHAIGIELNEEYLRIAADRLAQLSLLT